MSLEIIASRECDEELKKLSSEYTDDESRKIFRRGLERSARIGELVVGEEAVFQTSLEAACAAVDAEYSYTPKEIEASEEVLAKLWVCRELFSAWLAEKTEINPVEGSDE